MPKFNEEQIKELETIFGLVRVENTLPIKDGRTTKSMMVWWHNYMGPKHIKAEEHWDNIEGFPMFYSIKEPNIRVEYLD